MTAPWYQDEDADGAGASSRFRRRWFDAGWKARDARAKRQLDAVSKACRDEISMLFDRTEKARDDADQLRKERDYLMDLLKLAAVPE